MVLKNAGMDKDRFPVRKSPRIPGFDYATPNYYFITICTHEKRCLFWNHGVINQLGQVVLDGILGISVHFPKNRVDCFVIMLNHIHLILVVEPGGTDVCVVVGALKSYVSRVIHQTHPQLHVWQASFHDHGIRNQKQYAHIRTYIENNPIQWEKDCFYTK